MAALLGCLPTSPAEVAFPGPAPGTASAEQDASGYTLSNNILTAKFILRNGSLSFGGMTSKLGPVARQGMNYSSSIFRTDGALNPPS